jgi:hypothetical protein
MKPLLAILVPVIALCAVFAAFHLGAQTTPIAINQQLSTFGMVGLSAGETARLNAFALPMGGPVVAGGCEVTFTFYDDKGSSLASTTLPVTQGQAVHFDLTGTAAQEIRGTVRTMFNSPTAGVRAFNGCSVLPTEEIFNSSGQVIAVLELSHALPTILPL